MIKKKGMIIMKMCSFIQIYIVFLRLHLKIILAPRLTIFEHNFGYWQSNFMTCLIGVNNAIKKEQEIRKKVKHKKERERKARRTTKKLGHSNQTWR